MLGYAKRLARMLTGGAELAASDQYIDITNVPMPLFCGKHQLQAVWGQSPTASVSIAPRMLY